MDYLKDYFDNPEGLRCYMDETSAPYPENENPFPRTPEDDAFDEMLIKKYHLVTKEMEAEMETAMKKK